MVDRECTIAVTAREEEVGDVSDAYSFMHASLLTPQISPDTIRSMTTTDTQADDQTLNMSGHGSLGILREYNRERRLLSYFALHSADPRPP